MPFVFQARNNKIKIIVLLRYLGADNIHNIIVN